MVGRSADCHKREIRAYTGGVVGTFVTIVVFQLAASNACSAFSMLLVDEEAGGHAPLSGAFINQ